MFCVFDDVSQVLWTEVETGRYHHLDVQTIVRADVESSFGGSDTSPCGGIVRFPHRICFTVAALYGLVDYFQHADIPVVVVRMDDVRHPLKEFVSAFVLVIHVETRRGGVLGRSIQLNRPKSRLSERQPFGKPLPVPYPNS